jgi:hypothetical protein
MSDEDAQARQLRNHYLATADERPVDGQLEAVLERTRVVRPRSRVETLLRQQPVVGAGVAGLRTSLRFAAVAAALIVVLAVVAIGPGGSRPTTPFEGRWTSTDFDGSRQMLAVAAGPTPIVSYEDLFASACAANGDRSTHFFAEGGGTIKGTRMTVAFPSGGGCVTWHVEPYEVVYTHDAATDRLLDTDGIWWRRAP